MPGRCIPRSGKDSVDRPLNVLIFLGLGPADNLKVSGSCVLLVCYDPGNGGCLLLVPISRAKLL